MTDINSHINRMTTSVALCTCNGEKYIKSQLYSILEQTVQVDEIIICDDSSSDNTIQIVNKIKTETKIPIQVFSNEKRLGVCANFDRAIHLCSSDIILLADQDDIWLPTKVDKIVTYFRENPYVDVLFTNGLFIDSDGIIFTSKKLFDAVGLTHRQIKFIKRGLGLELLLMNNRATGATMALRKSFIPIMNIECVKDGNETVALHDYLLALQAAAYNTLGVIDEPLIKYRIHGNQQVGFGRWIDDPPKTRPLSPMFSINERLIPYIPEKARKRVLFIEERKRMRKSFACIAIIRGVKNYFEHYRNLAPRLLFWDFFCGLISRVRNV